MPHSLNGGTREGLGYVIHKKGTLGTNRDYNSGQETPVVSKGLERRGFLVAKRKPKVERQKKPRMQAKKGELRLIKPITLGRPWSSDTAPQPGRSRRKIPSRFGIRIQLFELPQQSTILEVWEPSRTKLILHSSGEKSGLKMGAC